MVKNALDVAVMRLADAVRQLVDDEAVLVLERRRHALAFDSRDLEAERDDEDRVDRGRHERLHPGDELFLQLRESEAGARQPEIGRCEGGPFRRDPLVGCACPRMGAERKEEENGEGAFHRPQW